MMDSSVRSALSTHIFLLVTLSLIFTTIAINRVGAKTIPIADSTKASSKSGLKPYRDVIKAEAQSSKGLFTIHKVGESYYFEIPDSILGREILSVSRTAQTGSGTGNGGELIGEKLYRFERSPDRRHIFMRVPNTLNIAMPDSEIYQAYRSSFIEPIAYTFDIKCEGTDSSAVVEVTDFYAKDILGFVSTESAKTKLGLTTLEDNKSYIEYVKAFPINIECSSVKTYKRSKAKNSVEDCGYATMQIHYSMLLLPKKPMRPRLVDERIGFLSQNQIDYSADPTRVKKTYYIRRWRLEPSDMEAFMRGEIVEPINPIIFYIDSSTPDKWKPYFKQAVEDWQEAFERAGFKNAILAKDVPTKIEDPSWDAMDARHSMILYFASTEQNAYGPHVADPRSGEIVEAHVGIYHNIMNMISKWYRIQTGAANPSSRTKELSDSIMGALYRQVVGHEVGHSLGLSHNFAASSAMAVDSLRSPHFTDKYGTSASIMDYARYNYIAQPGDGVKRFIPIIGEYDKYAIEWGYRPIPGAKNASEETPTLDKWIENKANDRRYLYVKQKLTLNDPRAQTEDLGDDPIRAVGYALHNLEFVATNFDKWIYDPTQDYDYIKEFYEEILSQWIRYMNHVKSMIGGINETYKKQSQKGVSYIAVKKSHQKEAVDFLCKNAFNPPQWLIREDLTAQYDATFTFARTLRSVQGSILESLLSNNVLSRMIAMEERSEDNYKVGELLDDLRKYIFNNIYSAKHGNEYTHSLQRVYIDQLMSFIPNYSAEKKISASILNMNDLPLVTQTELNKLKSDLLSQRSYYRKNDLERSHINMLLERIENQKSR